MKKGSQFSNFKNSKMQRLSSKLYILIFIQSIIFSNYFSQENIFLERSFWKKQPNISIIDSCIKAGNDPTELNKFAFDAASWAIIENNPLETIKYLIAIEGNDVNKKTHDGRTYIFWAMYRDNLPLMNYLYDNGAKIDIIDSHGYSLMNFGAVTGQTNTALYDFCFDRGTKLDEQKNNDGANPLLLVSPFLDNDNLLNYFISKGIDIKDKDNNGNGIFNYASKRGNKQLLLKLIDQGVDFLINEKINTNAMIFASYGTRGFENSLETYLFLDSLGIDPKIISKDGETPLHNLAYKTKNKEIINFFKQKGADFNHINMNGDNPLMNACLRNDLSIIKLFLDETENINLKNNKGKSALSNAVCKNSSEIVAHLIDIGCDFKVNDNSGNNLIFQLIENFKANDSVEFENKLNILLQIGVETKDLNSKGETIFHLAIEKNNTSLLEKFIQLGLDINKADKNGLTPLHLAVMKAKNMEIIEFLVKHGGDIKAKTNFGETAYDLALENELLNKTKANIKILKQ